MAFKERLKKIVMNSGIKRAEFAKHGGISRTQLFRYLNGEQEPSTAFYRNIKKHHPWINVDWLVTGAGEPFKQTPGARYRDLREVLKTTYEGEHKERIFNLLEREDLTTLEKTIFLYTILTFLREASENDGYLKLMQRWASFINEENVDGECEESRRLVKANLLDFDRLFELAQFGFEYDQPGLVFFFYQMFNSLELWAYDPQKMTVKIKLFGKGFVTHNPFTGSEEREKCGGR